MPIVKLISGGQTGADRAALDVAIQHGFPHGGWCPEGRKAEDGPIGNQYQLTETPGNSYARRTEWNVRDTDGTVVFTLAAKAAGGSLATMEFAARLGKPCLHISRAGDGNQASRLREFVQVNDIKHLNVAGSRESKEPGIHGWVTGVIEKAFF